jgi:hypothetical protein
MNWISIANPKYQTFSRSFHMKTSRQLLLSMTVALVGSAFVTTAAAQGRGNAARDAALPASSHSLTAVTTPAAAPDADGFIQRWMLLEPIPCNGQATDNAVQATVKKEYFPNQFTVIPKDGDKETVDGQEYTWHAMDTRNYNVNLLHFAYFLNKSSNNAIFWAVTVVNCPEELRDVRLAIGSNSASVWWVNGQEVAGVYGDIQTVVDDGVSKRITLKPGPNIVRVAVVNNGGATDFCARFLDAEGKPVKGFTLTAGNVNQP